MKRLAIAVAVLALVVAACGDSAGTTDNPRKIEIDAGDFAFNPGDIDISPGETVEFIVTNTGVVAHEFVVTNQSEIDEHLEAGHATGHGDEDVANMDEMDGMEGMAAREVQVEPGETKSLTITFDDAGDLARFACLIEGHYEAGMVGDFNFEG
ncbi:MAG TPA: plastocyanin/azurin family copper-binding protein [Acidimicrobiia bacterium]|nr:plastocyanin/azurin family copper-binding protein [Acidimicrobiia bacterium]